MRRLAFLPFLLLAAGARAQLVWEKPLAPGLTYREEVDRVVPRVIHVLRITPASPAVRLTIEPTGGAINEAASGPTGRTTVGQAASRSGTLAATNGDFFVDVAKGWTGHPLGLMVRDGELVATPNPRRSALAWGPEGVAFGKAEWKGTAGSIALGGVNRAPGANEVVLDTPIAGQAIGSADATFVTLRLGETLAPTGKATATVRSIGGRNRPVEKGTAVLVGRGAKAEGLRALRKGDTLTVTTQTTGFDWNKYDRVVSGGPMLVQDGETAIDDEGFPADSFVKARHPRTAIGRTAQGDLLLVAVDGRSPVSVGASLAELASILRRLGCVEAMNLDGGGSTTLAALGLTLNRPSDGKERPVANALVVRGDSPSPVFGPLKLVVPATVRDGDDARVVDAQGHPVPNARVLWSATGAVWMDQGGRLSALASGTGVVRAAVDGQVLVAKVTVSAKLPRASKKSE